jgi:quercetin dioxygenase-like cupin family protein
MTQRMQGFVSGVLAGLAVAIVLFDASAIAGLAVSSVDSPTKYTSKVVLDNERVRVKDVTFPPGVLDTGMHTHDLAHVGVILTKGALRFTDPAGILENVQFEAGSVGFREAGVTHQVANPGSAPMRVIEVELK